MKLFHRVSRRLQVALLAVVALAGSGAAAAQLSDTEVGRQVMVDYIVHFAYHLQWPIEVYSGTSAPFRICVLGEHSLAESLPERLQHHRISGRKVAVEKLMMADKLRARRCQIVLFGNLNADQVQEAFATLEFFPVLTVSDSYRFAASGGMVGFAGTGSRVSLQLNKTMLEKAELKEGSSLFRLSRTLN